jgi:predicted transcriptional regulator
MFSNSDEFTNDLDGRDSCEILLKELKEKKDISKLKERIKKADKILQKDAAKLFERFCEYYEDDEWDYYPKSYWWRHLKEFVEEKGGTKNDRID